MSSPDFRPSLPPSRQLASRWLVLDQGDRAAYEEDQCTTLITDMGRLCDGGVLGWEEELRAEWLNATEIRSVGKLPETVEAFGDFVFSIRSLAMAVQTLHHQKPPKAVFSKTLRTNIHDVVEEGKVLDGASFKDWEKDAIEDTKLWDIFQNLRLPFTPSAKIGRDKMDGVYKLQHAGIDVLSGVIAHTLAEGGVVPRPRLPTHDVLKPMKF